MFLSRTASLMEPCGWDVKREEYCVQDLGHSGCTQCTGSEYHDVTQEIILACSPVIAVWGDRSPCGSSLWACGCGSVSL